MKTLKRFNSMGIITVLCLLAASCAKDNSSLVKSSKLTVNFATIKGGVLKSAGSTKGSAVAA